MIFILVQNFHESKETGDIFQKYSKNLNISQITVWVCHKKKYYPMNMITSCQSKFNFWVSNQVCLISNMKYY